MSAVQVFLITSLVHISHFQRITVMDEQERLSYEKMLMVPDLTMSFLYENRQYGK